MPSSALQKIYIFSLISSSFFFVFFFLFFLLFFLGKDGGGFINEEDN